MNDSQNTRNGIVGLLALREPSDGHQLSNYGETYFAS
jgi:hypothetical protein